MRRGIGQLWANAHKVASDRGEYRTSSLNRDVQTAFAQFFGEQDDLERAIIGSPPVTTTCFAGYAAIAVTISSSEKSLPSGAQEV